MSLRHAKFLNCLSGSLARANGTIPHTRRLIAKKIVSQLKFSIHKRGKFSAKVGHLWTVLTTLLGALNSAEVE